MTDEEFLTLAEVKALLEKEQEGRELSMEQKYALSHAQKFAKIEVKDSRKLYKELAGIKQLSDGQVCKLVDILPEYSEEVRAIFAKERMTLEPEVIEEILKAIKKYH
ncbi:MAG: RNA polymerase Rpb4 family protein [Candidatus Dadabacteria bacterium]|nr:RNA polymerase Rpb4 family protein [Candidatus Dadabacteria bacterium]